MLYHLIALLVFTISVMRGFRRGLGRQLPQLIGFCFGVVCAHIFAEPLLGIFRDWLPSIGARPEGGYIYDILSRGLIYILVYEVFSFCTFFLKYLFPRSSVGMLGSLGGAVFCAVRYMLMLSVVYNLILCCTMDGTLLRCARSYDGNIAEEVMLIAPAILGGESIEDLTHILQLEAAKSIS